MNLPLPLFHWTVCVAGILLVSLQLVPGNKVKLLSSQKAASFQPRHVVYSHPRPICGRRIVAREKKRHHPHRPVVYSHPRPHQNPQPVFLSREKRIGIIIIFFGPLVNNSIKLLDRESEGIRNESPLTQPGTAKRKEPTLY